MMRIAVKNTSGIRAGRSGIPAIRSMLLPLLLAAAAAAVSGNGAVLQSATPSNEHRDITDLFPIPEFENVKSFILANGDRETYCSLYSHNPHLACGGIDAFLNPDIGQNNINCDTALSDFNEIVLRDPGPQRRHNYGIHAVRSGDLANPSVTNTEWMAEGRVYLITEPNDVMDSMVGNVRNYLAIIEACMEVRADDHGERPAHREPLRFNPATQQLAVDIQSLTEKSACIIILDIRGRVAVRQRIVKEGTVSVAVISLFRLPRGFYAGYFRDGDHTETLTFLKN